VEVGVPIAIIETDSEVTAEISKPQEETIKETAASPAKVTDKADAAGRFQPFYYCSFCNRFTHFGHDHFKLHISPFQKSILVIPQLVGKNCHSARILFR